jgi:hypothetical protein
MKLNTSMIKIFTPIIKFFSFLKNVFRKCFYSCKLITVFVKASIRKIYFILKNFFSYWFFNNQMVYKYFKKFKNIFCSTYLVYTTSFPIEFNSFLCIDTTIAKKVFNFLKDFFISIHYIYYWYITYTLFYFLWFSFSDIKTTFAIDKSSNIIDCNHWYYYNIYYNRLKGGILL